MLDPPLTGKYIVHTRHGGKDNKSTN